MFTFGDGYRLVCDSTLDVAPVPHSTLDVVPDSTLDVAPVPDSTLDVAPVPDSTPVMVMLTRCAARVPPPSLRCRVYDAKSTMEKTAKRNIFAMLSDGSAPESRIRARFGNDPGVSKALRLLLRGGRVTRTGRGGRSDPFVYCMLAKTLEA